MTGPKVSERWSRARAAIAVRDEYGCMDLPAQLGLVPLGEDPDSTLWEFWHVLSGTEPRRVDGRLVVTEDTGMVFILLPGGTFLMGAQNTDRNGWNYDAFAEENEGPVHEVPLSSFFLSKYEMTQGQWLRLNGVNPSLYQGVVPGAGDYDYDLRHPVEHVTWPDCRTTLLRAGLVLPSEAQWEYGARGGGETAWWTGGALSTLEGAANVADPVGARIRVVLGKIVDFEDGYGLHAPVGTFLPHPFGLHDVHGNAFEWCRDWFDNNYYRTKATDAWEIDPVGEESPNQRRACRGGDFRYDPQFTRSVYVQKNLGARRNLGSYRCR